MANGPGLGVVRAGTDPARAKKNPGPGIKSPNPGPFPSRDWDGLETRVPAWDPAPPLV